MTDKTTTTSAEALAALLEEAAREIAWRGPAKGGLAARLREAIASLEAQPKAQAQAADETAWLIEHHEDGRLHYLSAQGGYLCHGNTDTALRFARKQDAEALFEHYARDKGLAGNHRWREAFRIAEHMWPTPSPEARETVEPAFATDRSFGWCPDQCPITRLPFFMWIQHPRDGWVPTYGGPLDSYTIPVMGGLPTEPFHERPLERERFDHDAGYWVDGVEEIPLRVAHDDALAAPVSQAEPSTSHEEKENAARYRWLRDHWLEVRACPATGRMTGVRILCEDDDGIGDGADRLDAAIDAARTKEKT